MRTVQVNTTLAPITVLVGPDIQHGLGSARQDGFHPATSLLGLFDATFSEWEQIIGHAAELCAICIADALPVSNQNYCGGQKLPPIFGFSKGWTE